MQRDCFRCEHRDLRFPVESDGPKCGVRPAGCRPGRGWRIGGKLGGDDVSGDESKAFEAIPVFGFYLTEDRPNCPGVPGFEP